MKSNFRASKWAFLFVVVVVGGSFLWWFQTRPSFLLFQAHSQMGKENQAAVVNRYRRLLSKKGLDKEEEVRLRLALGEFYIEASGEFGTVVLGESSATLDVSHPFLAKAKTEFEKVLKIEPDNAIAHYNVGRVLLFRGLTTYAMEELELARQTGTQYPQPLALLSRIHQDRGQPEIGRDLALQALAIAPGYDRARWELVESYALLGDTAGALKEYKQLSYGFKERPEIRSHFALFLADQNLWSEAESEIKKAVEQSPGNLWVRLDQGRILIREGRLDEASGVLAHAATLHSKSPWPLVWLAQLNSLRLDCDRVGWTAQLLVRGLPRWSWSHMTRAWFYLCQGNEGLALAELEETLRLTPHFFEAVRLKADIFLDKKEFTRLGALLRPLLDEKMYEAEGYSLLSRSFYEQGQWDLAKETAESAIHLNSHQIEPYLWLGLSRIQTGDGEAARRAFQSAIRLNPGNPRTLGYYALYFHFKKDWENAEFWMQEAIRRAGGDADLWLLQGQIQLARNQIPEAIQSFQQASSLKPYMLDAHLGLVKAFWQRGNLEAAEVSLNSTLRINSKNKDVLSWRRKIRKDS